MSDRIELLTSAGRLDVVFNDATRAAVMTPSNWGTYPELRTTLNRRPVFGIAVYLTRDDAGVWTPDATTRTGSGLAGVYVSRVDDRPATMAQLRAAVAVAVDAIDDAIAMRPDALVDAQRAAVVEQKRRLTDRLTAVNAERAAIIAELRALVAPPAADRPRVAIPDGAHCQAEDSLSSACAEPAARMLLYTGRPGAGVDPVPSQPLCAHHAAGILKKFSHCYVDVTAPPAADPSARCAFCFAELSGERQECPSRDTGRCLPA